jgi:hypothetical protein
VGDGVGVRVGVAVTVGVGLGVGSTIGVGVGVGEVDEVGVEDDVGVELGDLIATPLFQTNFFPDFIQVNFLPPEVAVCPCFLQTAPAFMALSAGLGKINEITTAKARHRPNFMTE